MVIVSYFQSDQRLKKDIFLSLIRGPIKSQKAVWHLHQQKQDNYVFMISHNKVQSDNKLPEVMMLIINK